MFEHVLQLYLLFSDSIFWKDASSFFTLISSVKFGTVNFDEVCVAVNNPHCRPTGGTWDARQWPSLRDSAACVASTWTSRLGNLRSLQHCRLRAGWNAAKQMREGTVY